MNTAHPVRSGGKVKFFNSQKGYGFIIPDAGDVEVFVHHTAILNNGGFRSLAEGETVEYDVVKGPKGWQASNVSGPNGRPVRGDHRVLRPSFRPHYLYKPHPTGLLLPTSPVSPPLTPAQFISSMSPTPTYAPNGAPLPSMTAAYYTPHGWVTPYQAYGYPTSSPMSPTMSQGIPYFGTYPSPGASGGDEMEPAGIKTENGDGDQLQGENEDGAETEAVETVDPTAAVSPVAGGMVMGMIGMNVGAYPKFASVPVPGAGYAYIGYSAAPAYPPQVVLQPAPSHQHQ
ncbi:hypothetical protein SpCBS45565_g06215 [Spizellomyces sp. 'palustris']|nr:hypothetical protein SpCBS45565_g06215 [Spizellomyces sp. 'palustris']